MMFNESPNLISFTRTMQAVPGDTLKINFPNKGYLIIYANSWLRADVYITYQFIKVADRSLPPPMPTQIGQN